MDDNIPRQRREDISESEAGGLKEPEEVKNLHWSKEEEDRYDAQWYAYKWKHLAEVKQSQKGQYKDIPGHTVLCKDGQAVSGHDWMSHTHQMSTHSTRGRLKQTRLQVLKNGRKMDRSNKMDHTQEGHRHLDNSRDGGQPHHHTGANPPQEMDATRMTKRHQDADNSTWHQTHRAAEVLLLQPILNSQDNSHGTTFRRAQS